ncbi:MAG: argininosuccinate lyase [Candidatus Aureabacteria bacterium]|nr:argininosuccinate lyase [Candidatus Auribacterota bacterium]
MKKQSIIRGRFKKEMDEKASVFSASHSFDRKLLPFDIAGSKAHAKMLHKIGLLKKGECDKILKGLNQVQSEIQGGRFPFHDSLEDIHMHVEARLIELTGEAGKKLHTGRSRNDQVATDFRLYCRKAAQELVLLLEKLNKTLLEQAIKHESVFMPGYTHLQQAQVIRAGQHFLAYLNMFERDRSRLMNACERMDELPLGSGALAGTGLGNDRNFLAKELGFSKVTDNSLDAVSDRDFALELLFCIAMTGLHLSRYCEDLIIWFSSEFDAVTIDSSFCTGSSLMPQKSNPDMAELIRGKSGRFTGNLVRLCTTIKALPLSYNRDLQEDKEPVFDSVEEIKKCLEVFTAMLATVSIKKDLLSRQKNDYMLATDLAEYLVKKGIPFRKAHEVTGKLVQYAIQKKKKLSELHLTDYHKFSSQFDSGIYKILDLTRSPDGKNTFGGTSIKEVRRQILKWEKLFKKRHL